VNSLTLFFCTELGGLVGAPLVELFKVRIRLEVMS